MWWGVVGRGGAWGVVGCGGAWGVVGYGGAWGVVGCGGAWVLVGCEGGGRVRLVSGCAMGGDCGWSVCLVLVRVFFPPKQLLSDPL